MIRFVVGCLDWIDMEPRQKREIERSVGDVADRMRELVNIQHERRLAELVPKPREDLALELLTEMEVEELETMIKQGDGLAEWSRKRCEEDHVVVGLYAELDQLGMVMCAEGCVLSVKPKGQWAVRKFRQREKEAEAARDQQWRHDRNMEIVNAGISAIAGLVGVLVGAWLSVG